mmetsp:Transcript_89575/g.252465  ORF Transcript_89575/g.252465 Transcript_89575/m.252465 type:complete len:327 (+) Transcript_89575:406-1386(+)
MLHSGGAAGFSSSFTCSASLTSLFSSSCFSSCSTSGSSSSGSSAFGALTSPSEDSSSAIPLPAALADGLAPLLSVAADASATTATPDSAAALELDPASPLPRAASASASERSLSLSPSELLSGPSELSALSHSLGSPAVGALPVRALFANSALTTWLAVIDEPAAEASTEAASSSSINLRKPSLTKFGRSAATRFNLFTYSGSKVSATPGAFGSSGPSPVISFTSSSSAFFFSIHSLIRSTALECRIRRPVRSRLASKLVVFFPLPFWPRSNAPKPPLPPSNRKRSLSVHGAPAPKAFKNAVAERSSSRSRSRKSSRKSSPSTSSS